MSCDNGNCEDAAGVSVGILTETAHIMLDAKACAFSMLNIDDDVDYLTFCLSSFESNRSPVTTEETTSCGTATYATGKGAKQATATASLQYAELGSKVTIAGSVVQYVGATVLHEAFDLTCGASLEIDGMLFVPYTNSRAIIHEGMFRLLSANYSRDYSALGDGSFTVDYASTKATSVTL